MWLSPVGTSTYTGGRRQEGGRGQSDESGLVGPGESGQRGGGADIAVLRLPFPGHALDSYLKPLLSAYLTGWAARRGPGFTNPELGLFRAASLRTQRAPFSALGSPAITPRA